jgi:hypothetical protein
MYPDHPGRYPTDTPGMNYDASLGAPCDNYDVNTFGRGPGGESLVCHYIPNQWPPVYTGFWVSSYPIQGVKDIGHAAVPRWRPSLRTVAPWCASARRVGSRAR